LGGRASFTVDVGPYVKECLAAVRNSLGGGFDHLCDVKTVDVYSYPVLGWIVTLRPSPGQGEKGKMIVDVKPVFLSVGVEGRDVVLSTGLGVAPDTENLDVQTRVDTIDGGEEVIGVLPAWPNTYYVAGHVNGIAFSLGVHVNPDDEGLVRRLLKAYIDWLKGPEARKLKDKLAKPGNTV
jgi:hypothetical protein